MNTLVQNFNFVDTAAGLSNVYYVYNGGVVLITRGSLQLAHFTMCLYAWK